MNVCSLWFFYMVLWGWISLLSVSLGVSDVLVVKVIVGVGCLWGLWLTVLFLYADWDTFVIGGDCGYGC